MRRRLLPFAVLALLVAACSSTAGAPEPETRDTPAARATAESTPTASPSPTPAPVPTRPPTPRATPAPTPTRDATPVFGDEPTGPVQQATLVRVVDGDTIRVLVDGVERPVRYIGIDTPEVHGGVEPLGPEASQANEELLRGRRIILEKDVSETDRYDRLLRYVWVEDDGAFLLVNVELLRRGLAQITTYPPDVKYVDNLYLGAQQEARQAGLGLWGAPPTPDPAAPQPVAPAGNCEASYPDVCIPIGSADLDCGDLDARRFTVLWNVANPDPHRFDGDADGIGCES